MKKLDYHFKYNSYFSQGVIILLEPTKFLINIHMVKLEKKTLNFNLIIKATLNVAEYIFQQAWKSAFMNIISQFSIYSWQDITMAEQG